MSRSPGPVAALVVILALLTGCGGKDAPGAAPSPTGTTSSTPAASASGAPTTAPVRPRNLPTSYPLAEVPLIDGQVRPGGSGTPGGDDGGWEIALTRQGSAADCLAAAGAALVARGFTEQVVRTSAGQHQAQYTSPRYAVLVSATDEGGQGCAVEYTVGALGG